MQSNQNLLVFNFVMDPKHPLLSHQYEAVKALVDNFTEITVITGEVGDVVPDPRIRIVSTSWKKGNPWRNILLLLAKSLPVIIRGNFRSVFFHMTDLQAAVLSPFIFFRRRRQYLWYAHKSKSKFLLFASQWVTNIVTSTEGSCPISGKIVKPIGQAINPSRFQPIPISDLNFDGLIHIGRFDKSKNIQLLVSSAVKIKMSYPNIRLTVIGSPANAESIRWAENLIQNSAQEISAGWLNFKESIPRSQFPLEISGNGCFFHAYTGSLDKTLIESTMLRIPVITINPEYISIFGTWAKSPVINLENEYLAFRSRSLPDVDAELARRLEVAIRGHSLKHWIGELTGILN